MRYRQVAPPMKNNSSLPAKELAAGFLMPVTPTHFILFLFSRRLRSSARNFHGCTHRCRTCTSLNFVALIGEGVAKELVFLVEGAAGGLFVFERSRIYPFAKRIIGWSRDSRIQCGYTRSKRSSLKSTMNGSFQEDR